MLDAKHVRRGGLVSAIAGGLFVPYALTKGTFTSVIVSDQWHVLGLSAVETANLVHVLESVPLVLMAVGMVSLSAQIGASGLLARVGAGVTLMGFGLTILTHVGEHLLAPVTMQAVTGSQNLFMWAYYLSWVVLYAGIALYGAGLVQTDVAPRWLLSLFASLLPTAVLTGLVLASLDMYTVAGTFRVVFGLTWVIVGRWLWVGPIDPVSWRSDFPANHGTNDRR